MGPAEILPIVDGIRHTTPEHGRQLYDFILENRLGRCLELGFAYGVGTVWMAAAADQLGGKVVAVDRASVVRREPAAKDLLAKAGLTHAAELHYDPIGYTWHLQRKLEEYAADPFDFIFLDGAHTWDVDGFTFFLCDRVLKPGGWILFDDLTWTFRGSRGAMKADWVQKLTDEELDAPQIGLVWNKLVKTHPGYSEFREAGTWGWARKASRPGEDRKLIIEKAATRSFLSRALRKLGI